jgi:hypothetical protein
MASPTCAARVGLEVAPIIGWLLVAVKPIFFVLPHKNLSGAQKVLDRQIATVRATPWGR